MKEKYCLVCGRNPITAPEDWISLREVEFYVIGLSKEQIRELFLSGGVRIARVHRKGDGRGAWFWHFQSLLEELQRIRAGRKRSTPDVLPSYQVYSDYSV